jgi:hypothetical protein
VSASHIVVQLSHGTSARDVTVLLVQVVLVGCTAVSQPNTVVLDVTRVALRDLKKKFNIQLSELALV